MLNYDNNKSTNKCNTLIHQLKNAKEKAHYFENKLKIRDNRFALFRLISTIAFLAFIVGLFSKQNQLNNFILIFLFLIYCLITSWIHGYIQMKLRKWRSFTLSYELSLARINRNFEMIEENISPWHDDIIEVPKGHIYSSDLDVHTQLFSLFNTCSTQVGSEKLFQLFMEAGINPSPSKTIEVRSAKAKLISKSSHLIRKFEALRLDENFISKFYKQKEKIQFEESQKEIVSHSKEKLNNKDRAFFYIQNIFCIISIMAWILILLPAMLKFINTSQSEFLIQPLFLYALFIFLGAFIFNSITEMAAKVAHSTKMIEEVIKSLKIKNGKTNSFHFSFLEKSAIKNINSLNFLINLISLRGNPIFWITLHLVFPFDAVICFILQFKLKSVQKNLPEWENDLYEFDLLASFARFHNENPTSRFITQEERANTSPLFMEFHNLGHPLIAEENRICNSIKLMKSSPVVLLTGSNMAGKSTFLRTLGTNILLSNMGAPVCAEKFIIQPSRLLCAIRIDDSLEEGTSYFYAEVKRLKYILDSLNELHSVPGIFLIDEIFRGTNNKERFTGSYHIIHKLFEKNSFGFISTHDLALAQIHEEDKRMVNMHFREHVEDNKLVFDYLIKEGACPTTNALFIMKQEGLPIP
ncbi:MutS-related protein [Silvanigrella aquatica]|uniref:DNA mismatch repair proteins mutS family domain-containing protein n=1 Tax=Silvanigrella aquatica TaxID=1915309 RepID=A0A1L4D095_9BACT|nr:hypothetical protein [Silvanigrella aquatica]APJ03614.1 hypothetical protein AXG55_06715 [Silvanigrella aquatica]